MSLFVLEILLCPLDELGFLPSTRTTMELKEVLQDLYGELLKLLEPTVSPITFNKGYTYLSQGPLLHGNFNITLPIGRGTLLNLHFL